MVGTSITSACSYTNFSSESGKHSEYSVSLPGFNNLYGCSYCIDAYITFCVQIVVPETTAVLQDLLPDTDYNVGVVALYSDGEGPAINDAGKTCKYPKTQH